MPVSTVVCAALVLAGLTSAESARAQPAHPRARLDYRVEPGLPTCPNADELRSQVVARLGYDPFDTSAPQRVVATLRREGQMFVATVRLELSDGAVRERQPLSSAAADCGEIGAAVALAVSIAIDPLSLTRAPPPPSPSVTTPDKPAPKAPPTPTPPPEVAAPQQPERTHEARVGAGILGSVGALPAPSFGPSLFIGAAIPSASLSLEGRYDLPVERTGAAGAVRASLLLAALVPCIEPGPLAVCGIFTGGALFGAGENVDRPAHDTTPYIAIGARAAIGQRVTDRFRLRLQIDAETPLRPTTLQIAGADAWRSPVLFGTLGIVIIGAFL
jgi:hypothetical protein